MKQAIKYMVIFLVGSALLWFFWAYFLFGAWVVTLSAKEYLQRENFRPSVWKDESAWQSLEHPRRIHMVDDLLEDYELNGMTHDQIEMLLGPTDDTECFSGSGFVYWLGPERGLFSIDSEWLILEVEDDRVVDVSIERD